VAADQQIPVRFLRQVMGDLVRAGLADATLGRTGGYRLARLPTQISLLEVIEAVEGDRRRRACVLRGGPCVLDRVCALHAVFAAAQDDALRRLRTTTIAEAIAQS
jgi:Rrf2 family protein